MKAPAFQFYVADYMQDTRMVSLAARGAWMDLLCTMWRSQNRGQVTSTIIGYARLFGCTVEQAKSVIEEIVDSQVCDSVTEGDGKVTLICRRMSREAKERESANLRQQRYRNKDRQESDARNSGGGDAAGDAEVTPPSSSSSSSSIHSDDKKRRASQAPDDFPLTLTLQEWAKKEAPGIDLDLETKNFLDHHRAKGSLFKDWAASWRTWMRNAATKYAPRQTSTPLAAPVIGNFDRVNACTLCDKDGWKQTGEGRNLMRFKCKHEGLNNEHGHDARSNAGKTAA